MMWRKKNKVFALFFELFIELHRAYFFMINLLQLFTIVIIFSGGGANNGHQSTNLEFVLLGMFLLY